MIIPAFEHRRIRRVVTAICFSRQALRGSRPSSIRRPGSLILVLSTVILLIGCGSSRSPVNPLAIDLNLKRGPYLQLGATDSIVVDWQTFSATEGALEFGRTESLGTRIETVESSTRHSVSLAGLEPNTYYYYQVYDGNQAVSDLLRFHTNHGPGDTEFSFLVVGDSGTGAAAMYDVANLIRASSVSLGLHTGDLVYPNGEDELYDSRFFYPYAPFLASNVMYPSLGNHDLLTDDGAPYFNNFALPGNESSGTKRYYSFDYAHAHFVALDTNSTLAIGSAQRMWLEQDLAMTTKPWKFVFFHHPPYSAGFQSNGTGRSLLQDPRVRRNLAPLFELYGVDIVFSGHAHSYERTFPISQDRAADETQEPIYTDPSGPIYIVTGGGGGFLTELDASSLNAQAISAAHIVEITLSGNELTGRAITPPGDVIDEFRVLRE